MKNQIRAGQGKMGHSRQNGQVVKYIKLRNTSYVLIFKWGKKKLGMLRTCLVMLFY